MVLVAVRGLNQYLHNFMRTFTLPLYYFSMHFLDQVMTTLDDPYPRVYLSQPMSHNDSVNTPTTSSTYLKYLMPEEEIRWVGHRD